MITNNRARQLLRRAALSAAMILMAAPGALADPPGYLFQDFNQTAPAAVSAAVPSLQRDAANQDAGSLAPVGTSSLDSTLSQPGHAQLKAEQPPADPGRSGARTAGH
jgi:hypothetical protein